MVESVKEITKWKYFQMVSSKISRKIPMNKTQVNNTDSIFAEDS